LLRLSELPFIAVISQKTAFFIGTLNVHVWILVDAGDWAQTCKFATRPVAGLFLASAASFAVLHIQLKCNVRLGFSSNTGMLSSETCVCV
jgi:hypothetical protein